MQNIWTPEYQSLLERLKKDIVVGPILAILDPYWRFYINIDWPKYVMGSVILQADELVKSRKA